MIIVIMCLTYLYCILEGVLEEVGVGGGRKVEKGSVKGQC